MRRTQTKNKSRPKVDDTGIADKGGYLSARGAQQKQRQAARKGRQRDERKTAEDAVGAHCDAL